MSDIADHKALTDYLGAGTKSGLIEALKLNRIPFHVRADGWPTTTWSAINKALAGGSGADVKSEPNFESLSEFIHGRKKAS